jgi:hypothetical protein
MRCQAMVMAFAQGQDAAIFRILRRPPCTSRAAAWKTRSAFGSTFASLPSRARSLLDAGPGQVPADAGPQAVVAPVGDRLAVAVAQQPLACRGVAFGGVPQ